MPELGIELELVDGVLPYTIVRRAPTVLHYFEFRSDREELWPVARGDDVAAFLDDAVVLWRRQLAARGPANPRALEQVEALCAQAAAFVQQGQVERARGVLSQAAALNGAARSPLVYQYITNLAVMDGSLFLAVHAQQEALRLAPENALYRRNLENLLRTPFKEFKKTGDS
jgi:tetratricopeptide (TPR) repeat protein